MPGSRGKPRVLVLGASRLIGHFVAVDLARRGCEVVAAARSFEPAQKFSLSESTVIEAPVVELETAALARLFEEQRADVVVNCVEVLRDGAGATAQDVHEAFVSRLIAAIRLLHRPILLAHIGVPGREEEDPTAFSLTKRQGERLIRRGIARGPRPWLEATRIAPRPIGRVLMDRPATVQEKWFARLYLLKFFVIATLTVFWCASGLIALTVAYEPAVETLTSRGFPAGLAHPITITSSVLDIAVGGAIAARRTGRAGLLAGIAVSAFYLLGAAVLTPHLWLEPLGALVKTGPAIILMMIALATLDRR
jgi:NAD(P)-dependent dehydrogenase (short-subunit alcohol dehydrogenase family)